LFEEDKIDKSCNSMIPKTEKQLTLIEIDNNSESQVISFDQYKINDFNTMVEPSTTMKS